MIERLTILPGRDKAGAAERFEVELRVGEVVSLVGPTGSGKSRFLADVEFLAQGDTPSGRRVLVNGAPPSEETRFSPDAPLVAQLSQNMNFVLDLSAEAFVAMHAESRGAADPEGAAREVLAAANALAGEPFSADAPLTALSGGQSRALMIADVALLSRSPVVLVDEIENAGIDRRRAVRALVEGQKIVLLATHDPILALQADRRLAFRNGAIHAVLSRSDEERESLAALEALDAQLLEARQRLREGLVVKLLPSPGASPK